MMKGAPGGRLFPRARCADRSRGAPGKQEWKIAEDPVDDQVVSRVMEQMSVNRIVNGW